jgi:hypothetical protein
MADNADVIKFVTAHAVCPWRKPTLEGGLGSDAPIFQSPASHGGRDGDLAGDPGLRCDRGSRALVYGVGNAALTGILMKASAEDGAIISYRTREGFPRLAVAW